MSSSIVHAPKAKPDPRPMRLAYGAAGLAAFSALATAIVMPARAVVVVPTVETEQAAPASTGTPVAVQRPIQYVQLLPGQTAPPGATVIDAAAPKPTAIVVTVPAPVRAPARKPIIIKTTQSGKVVK